MLGQTVDRIAQSTGVSDAVAVGALALLALVFVFALVAGLSDAWWEPVHGVNPRRKIE